MLCNLLSRSCFVCQVNTTCAFSTFAFGNIAEYILITVSSNKTTTVLDFYGQCYENILRVFEMSVFVMSVFDFMRAMQCLKIVDDWVRDWILTVHV